MYEAMKQTNSPIAMMVILAQLAANPWLNVMFRNGVERPMPMKLEEETIPSIADAASLYRFVGENFDIELWIRNLCSIRALYSLVS